MLEAVKIIDKVHSPWPRLSYASFFCNLASTSHLSVCSLFSLNFRCPSLIVSEFLPLSCILTILQHTAEMAGSSHSSLTRGWYGAMEERGGWAAAASGNVCVAGDQNPSSSCSSASSNHLNFIQILNLLSLSSFIYKKMNNHTEAVHNYTNNYYVCLLSRWRWRQDILYTFRMLSKCMETQFLLSGYEEV